VDQSTAPIAAPALPTANRRDAGERLAVRWLGRVPYRDAWQMQKNLAEARANDEIPDQLLLLEHDPVLTLGRYADERHIRASAAELSARGIEVIRVERGGEVTYHGPGQLVAYPILQLSRRGLLVRPLVRALEAAMIETCDALGVRADRRDGHPGCWCAVESANPRKIGALGIRVQRGVSYHGISLNVTVALADFDLIDACGMPDVESTSIAREAAWPDQSPSTSSVAFAAAAFAASLARQLNVGLSAISRRRLARRPDMPAGLFELRKDDITGWWVATVVDRAFHRDRFALAALPVDDGGDCRNCQDPPGDGVRTRTLKEFAFHVVGTESEARELDRSVVQVAMAQARASGSWRTVVAPPREHRPLSAVGTEIIQGLLAGSREAIAEARERGTTGYLQVVQNWGAQAGARTNHLCLDLYDLPQVPHRVAEELGGAARFVIREAECPFCRLVRDETIRRNRLVFEDAGSVAFAPFASRSPFEVWVVPRRHAADFGSATDADLRSTAETLRQVLARLARLDGPPYNLVLHTAPLKERVEQTYHWHWEIHPRLREIAGLEVGTGLPVNPVSPEDAVDELLRHAGDLAPEPAA
jgi:lipoate-protein ligase B